MDGKPLSMPIPTKMPTPTCFGDLNGLYAQLVTDLTKGRWTAQSPCHLDPDINPVTLPRLRGWRGSLGQVSHAQSHLANQDAQKGDLFIFWGLFRPVEKFPAWKFVSKPEHRIWGWLQIGEIINLGTDGSHALDGRPWLKDHPHARAGWSNPNVLYVASDELILGSRSLSLPGYGVLSSGFRLTAPGMTPSRWLVPDWLNPHHGGSGLTFNPSWNWNEGGILKSAAKGQEFVGDIGMNEVAHDWIKSLLLEELG